MQNYKTVCDRSLADHMGAPNLLAPWGFLDFLKINRLFEYIFTWYNTNSNWKKSVVHVFEQP